MLRLLMVSVAAGCLILPVGCQKVELKEFISPDGTFKVMMPEKKEEMTQSIGGATAKVWVSQFNDGALTVAAKDLQLSFAGKEGLPDVFAEVTLKESQKVAIETVKGELVSEAAIKLADKHPGRQFEAKVKVPKKNGDGEVDGIIKCRIYLVNGKLFQLQAIGKPEWIAGEEIPKFLDSLQILK